MQKNNINDFISQIPKAELHVHLEGCIEAQLMLKIADRNKITLKNQTEESLNQAFSFENLRDFLYLYNEGTRILKKPEDFYDVCLSYLRKATEQNILHAEIFIDFQTYLRRGIKAEVQMDGLREAIKTARKESGISVGLIHCFLRHLGPNAARKVFEEVLFYKNEIIGVGLASTEIGYPPELFTEVFDLARENGFKAVAHAGEEGPWEYVQNSIEYLKVDRIDHGNKSCQNEDLVNTIIKKQIPLTLCPLSNIKLKNVPNIKEHTIKKMLDREMLVTINSDDPAYFGGYVNENFQVVADAFHLSEEEIYRLAQNSFKASFIEDDKKKEFLQILEEFFLNWTH